MTSFPSLYIDSNILFKYLFEGDKVYKAINSYAELTSTKVYISKVSILEMVNTYKNKVIEIEQDKKKIIDKTKKILGNDVDISFIKKRYSKTEVVDIDKNNAEDFIEKKISNKFEIIDYEDNMLEEAIRRSTQKIRPCTFKKEEFRDTIIWLSFKNLYCKNNNILFMSDDSDFMWEGGSLHPDLVEEFEHNNVPIFFKSINQLRERYLPEIQPVIEKNEIDEILYSGDFEALVEEKLEKVEIYVDWSVDIDEHYVDLSYTDDYIPLLSKSWVSWLRIEEIWNEEITLIWEVEIEVEIPLKWIWSRWSASTHYFSFVTTKLVSTYFVYDIPNKCLTIDEVDLNEIEIEKYDLEYDVKDSFSEDLRRYEEERDRRMSQYY